MATAIQFRRGTTAQHANFTGLVGEITVDTDLDTIRVHDGSTAGGTRLAKYDEVVAAATGDITAVTTVAGSGLTGGAESGNVVLSLDYENLSGNLVPSANNTYSLGTVNKVWKDVFVGPGSLYVNGQQVLSDNSGTITISADTGQNISIVTTGAGSVELTSGSGVIEMKSNVQMLSGKTISTAGGGATSHTSNINMNSNSINNLADPTQAQDAATKAYVDTDATVVRVTGAQTIAGVKTFSDNVILNGDLTVAGTTTTVNSETISLADNIIDLNSNFTTGAPTENAGIRIQRGDETAAQLRWNEANDYWETVDGSGATKIALDTDDLTEGSTNLYYTTARANTDFDTKLAAADTDDLSEGATNLYHTTARARGAISAGGDLSYNSSTGVMSFTERTDAEVRGLISAGGDLSYNSSTGVMSFTERTDAEVRGLISATGDISYNSSTGVMSFTERTDAEVRGLISATGDISYDSATGVISFTNDAGDIESVTAGDGLTGGGTTGNVTLTVGAGNGITVNADNVAVDMSVFSTSDLSEGTNLYYTDTRARAAVSASGDLAYNSSTGVFSFTERTDAEVRGLVSASGDLSYNSTTGVFSVTTYKSADFDTDFSGKSTSDLSEGTNLYYTDTRVRAALSVTNTAGGDGTISYNNTTGVFTYNGPTQAEANSRIDAYLSGGDGIDVGSGSISVDTTVVRTSGAQTVGGAKTFTDDTVFSGNVTISGTQTIVNSTVTSLADSILELNRDATGAPSEDAGLNVNRGSSASVSFLWDETNDYWAFTNNGADYYQLAESTDDLAEGVTNLYYTTARASSNFDTKLAAADTDDLSEGATNLYYTDARARGAISVTDAGGDGSLSYNSGTGVITYTGPSASEVRAHVSAGGDLSYNSSTGVFSFTERTDAEVRGLVSASGDLSYNSSTGVFSFTERTESEVRGLISVNDAGGDGSLSYNSGTGVITYTGPSASEVRAHLSGGTGITYNSSTGVISLSDTGYISGVTAGNGLTGGGTAGNVTLNAVGGYGVTVNADNIELSNSDVRGLFSASGDVSYNNTTGVISFTERTDAEVRGLVSASGDLSYNSSTGVFSFTQRTDAQVRSLFSGGTGITYNSSTGAISLTDTGYVTGVTAGTGLSGGGTDGTVTLNVDLSELTDMTAAMTGTDEFIVLDAGADRRKAANEIGLSVFNNDVGFSTTTGTVTSIGTTGSVNGITLSGGTITTSGTITLGGTLSGITVAQLAASAVQTGAESFSDSDSVLMTAAAVQDKILSYGYTTNVGDITGVTAGSYLTGGGSSGSVTLNVDATSTNTASKVVARDSSGNFAAGVITATATAARYADLAEKYAADADYEPGTVVKFGGEKEITATDSENDHAVMGVISTDPAYMMNNDAEGVFVALAGRVPCKVTGPVAKGDLMVSAPNGRAKADNAAQAGRIIGKAMEASEGGEAVIEVLVNMM